MNLTIIAVLFSLLAISSTFAHDQVANESADKIVPKVDTSEQSGSEVVAQIKAAADALFESLEPEQQEKMQFGFGNDEQRQRWSNLPVGIVPRRGIRWGDLNEKQKDEAMELFKATLSPRGVQQIIDNMEGDEVLKLGQSGRRGPGGRREDRPGGGGPGFGMDNYFLAMLGKPSTNEPWMWQFGGHHLGINVTIAGDQITMSPSLTGGQPVDFEYKGRKVRQLAGEEDKAFELIGTLTDEQLKVAVIDSRAHGDLAFGPGKENVQPKQEGLNVSKLNDQQQELLLELIHERIGLLNDVHAKKAMLEIKNNLDETWFSWFGPTRPGVASSFRIQGPTLLLEYAPQHMGGDGTSHTHAMYRDPTNDYGQGLPGIKGQNSFNR